ncbi:MAG: LysE family translocator [Geminicoccales bacterium]
MAIDILLPFTAASIAIAIVPGPSVTLIIANSLRHGTRAGLLSVAGTQIGLAMMLAVLAAGLSTIIEHMGWIFDWLRLFGAAYLIWLGIKLWRSDGKLGSTDDSAPSHKNFFWEGLLVVWSNPKALLFFGAFIPQFVNPTGDAVFQTLLLGGIFMITATVLDSGYALAAGQAGRWMTGTKVRLLERISGSFLIGGGLWLAFNRKG